MDDEFLTSIAHLRGEQGEASNCDEDVEGQQTDDEDCVIYITQPETPALSSPLFVSQSNEERFTLLGFTDVDDEFFTSYTQPHVELEDEDSSCRENEEETNSDEDSSCRGNEEANRNGSDSGAGIQVDKDEDAGVMGDSGEDIDGDGKIDDEDSSSEENEADRDAGMQVDNDDDASRGDMGDSNEEVDGDEEIEDDNEEEMDVDEVSIEDPQRALC